MQAYAQNIGLREFQELFNFFSCARGVCCARAEAGRGVLSLSLSLLHLNGYGGPSSDRKVLREQTYAMYARLVHFFSTLLPSHESTAQRGDKAGRFYATFSVYRPGNPTVVTKLLRRCVTSSEEAVP